jgi:hypothetical protein
MTNRKPGNTFDNIIKSLKFRSNRKKILINVLHTYQQKPNPSLETVPLSYLKLLDLKELTPDLDVGAEASV